MIRSKYGLDEAGWWPSEVSNTTYRSPWKAIQGLLPVFLCNAKLKLGNGERFWEDAWVDREPFKDKYPNLFRLSLLHNKPISAFLVNAINPESSWNFHFRISVSDRELEELADLLSTLERASVCGALQDKWVWRGKVQDFSLANRFSKLTDLPNYTPFNFHHFIWTISIPNKVTVFGWLLILKKLNTHDLLQRRHPFLSTSPSWCVTCRYANESVNYLFLLCPVAQRIWTKIIQKFKVSWVIPQDINHLILGEFMLRRDRRIKLLWSLVLHSVLWTLWRERNQRIFEEKEGSLANIIIG